MVRINVEEGVEEFTGEIEAGQALEAVAQVKRRRGMETPVTPRKKERPSKRRALKEPDP